jgi:hypothetical protein
MTTVYRQIAGHVPVAMTTVYRQMKVQRPEIQAESLCRLGVREESHSSQRNGSNAGTDCRHGASPPKPALTSACQHVPDLKVPLSES